jgi:hypothetical protein
MRVRFVRTGGLAAAMRREYTADSATMSPEDAKELSRLIEAADFFQLPATGPTPQGLRDAFQYKLTVEMDGREHTIEMGQSAVPEKARDLLEWLENRARSGGR